MTLPTAARADALSFFGAGARSAGRAGAFTADASGWAAAHHNPAGAARTVDVEAAIGWGAAAPGLLLDGRDAGVTPPRGTTFGLAVPLPVRSVQVAFALALHLPDQYIARIRLVPPGEPHFVLLDNHAQRIVVTPVLAVRPARWLSLGAGATLLADAAGRGIDFDVGLTAGERVGRAALDVSLPIRAAPVAGVTFEPHPRARLAVAYRGSVDLGLSLDVFTKVDVAGALRGDVLIALRAVDLYTPHRVTFALAGDILPSLTIAAEVAWVAWSYFRGGAPDLRLDLALDVSPPLVRPSIPPPGFHDTWVPRVALEYRRAVTPRLAVAARAGYAFEPSPVPDQTGLTSYADADRSLLAFGLGLQVGQLAPVLRKPLMFDVAVGWHELHARTTVKDPAFLPGGGFTASGRLIHVSFTAEARF